LLNLVIIHISVTRAVNKDVYVYRVTALGTYAAANPL